MSSQEEKKIEDPTVFESTKSYLGRGVDYVKSMWRQHMILTILAIIVIAMVVYYFVSGNIIYPRVEFITLPFNIKERLYAPSSTVQPPPVMV